MMHCTLPNDTGFMQTPHILSDTHTKGYMFIIRLWPKRMTDTLKCVWDHDKYHERLSDISAFWSTYSPWLQKTVNVSNLHLIGQTYVDVLFDQFHEHNHRFQYLPIFVRCSTSSHKSSSTAKNIEYSSLLMATRPPHTQLFPYSV